MPCHATCRPDACSGRFAAARVVLQFTGADLSAVASNALQLALRRRVAEIEAQVGKGRAAHTLSAVSAVLEVNPRLLCSSAVLCLRQLVFSFVSAVSGKSGRKCSNSYSEVNTT